MTKRWPFLSLFLAVLVPQPSPLAGGTCRALLIGVDEYRPGVGPLKGCVQDTARFEKLLTDSLGVAPGGIRRLANPSKSEAVATIREHLIAPTTESDSVVLYFSGHGTRVPDLNGDEDDGWDEALLFRDTVPSNPNTLLIDDELGELLDEVSARNILLVIDSCHSGTANRSPTAPYTGSRGITIRYHPDEAKPGASFRPGSFAAGMVTGKPVTVLSACQPQQFANELEPAEIAALGFPDPAQAHGGLLTLALREAVAGRQDFTFKELAPVLTERVEAAVLELNRKKVAQPPRLRLPQKPHFQFPAPDLRLADFLGATTLVQAAPAAPRPAPPAAAGPDAAVVDPADGQVRRGPIRVTLKTNKDAFKAGDKLVITVTSEEDGFFVLSYVNARGQHHRLFPDDRRQNNAIRAGVPVILRGPDDEHDYVMEAPFGTEILKAVVADQPFDDLHLGDRPEAVWSSSRSAVSRGIGEKRRDQPAGETVPPAFRFGEATLVYDVWAD